MTYYAFIKLLNIVYYVNKSIIIPYISNIIKQIMW